MTRVGIVGGGQLGRMLALGRLPARDPLHHARPRRRLARRPGGAGDRRGLRRPRGARPSRDRRPTSSRTSSRTSPSTRPGAWPNVCAVHPAPDALETAQDRLAEKQLFAVGRPGRAAATSRWIRSTDLTQASDELGTPAVLKTRRLGYDGKGQAVDPRPAPGRGRVARGGRGAVDPGGVRVLRSGALDRGRAGPDGAFAAYPLVQNHHRDGILRLTRAPAPDATPALQAAAETYARDGDDSARLRGRARDRAVPGRGGAARQRDGAARAQLRPLDDRGRGDHRSSSNTCGPSPACRWAPSSRAGSRRW